MVDGNVYRLLSRYFNIDTPIDSTSGIREFFELANELIPASAPGDFNQAMMDFGSLVCKPTRPLCNDCPLSAGCLSLKHNTVASRPIKKGKTKVRKRYFLYLIVQDEQGFTLVRKRSEKDIWTGLYEFPLIEFDNEQLWKTFNSSKEYLNLLHQVVATRNLMMKVMVFR